MAVSYLFAMKEGKLFKEGCPGEKQNLSEQNYKIELMNLNEFRQLSGEYPQKWNLYRSMCQIQYCKVELFGVYMQGTMKVPGANTSDTQKGKGCAQTFGFYAHEGFLILIEDGDFLEHLLGKIACNTYGECSQNQFLLILFEALIEDDVLYLGQQEEKLSVIEEKLLKNLPEDFYEMMIRYRKQFCAYHVYYEQLVNIGDQMQGNFGKIFTEEECFAWKLYTNRMERLYNHVEMLREYLVQIRELYQSQLDVQQNKVMSILTAVTTIFLPLTLIAGWYGMNFPNMPEFQWRYAYPVILLVSVLIIVLEILFFRKKKML